MIVETKDGEVVSIDGFAADPLASPSYIDQQPDVLVVINHPLSAYARGCVSKLVQQIEGIVAQDRGLARTSATDDALFLAALHQEANDTLSAGASMLCGGQAVPASPSADTEPPTPIVWRCGVCGQNASTSVMCACPGPESRS